MDELALLGISHRRGGLSRLDAWKCGASSAWLARLDALGVTTRVLLDTCNRWDVVLTASPGELAALRAPLSAAGGGTLAYAYGGEAALEQLIRVIAALDSLNPGESQITAQVRRAYSAASAAGTTDQLLNFAFQTAFRAGKRVRRELDLTSSETSLFSLAKPRLLRSLRAGERVVVLGAGEIGTAAARSLAREKLFELVVVNRTLQRARDLADGLGAQSMALTEFLAAPPPAAALVTALAGGALLGAEHLERIAGLRLIVDLGGPSNVVAGAAPAWVEHVGVADLEAAGAERRTALAKKLASAEQLVTVETSAAVEEWSERCLAPAITRLRERYRALVAEVLPAGQAQGLASRLARPQIAGLRAVARHYGTQAAEVFIEEATL